MRKKLLCLVMAVVCTAVLSSCGRKGKEEREPSPTLPPAKTEAKAPEKDSLIGSRREVRIYLAGNELQMNTRETVLEPGTLYEQVTELVSQYLTTESAFHSGRRLTLYGEHPIELSNGICTVNLSGAALQMTYSDYYKTCIALATTLCELDEINFVNVLTADQSVGLDITGSLAMGSLTGHPDENLPVLWEQMEAKRTPLGDDMSLTPLNALVTIYYPLREGQGIGCENRILTFEGQTPHQLASGLLKAMGSVHRDVYGEDGLPNLSELLLHEPLTSELEDGGRLITLSFRENTEAILAERGIDLTCLMGSITYTLTTFIPGIAAVCVRIGDKPITGLESRQTGAIPVLSGILKRNLFEKMLMAGTTVFFARDGKLCRCERTLDQGLVDSPRAQLGVLLAGPDEHEQMLGMTAATPPGVREDDILGIALEGETLLVNLSEGFRAEIQAFGKENETLLCYSMVNTLCANTGFKRVCFFFEGEQVESIAGEIYWGGEFFWNPGLEDNGLG